MHLLIAAAGSGKRMGAAKNKLLLKINGKTIIEWTLKAILSSESIHWVGIIGQPVDKEEIMRNVPKTLKPVEWINGGSTRQQSVKLGLEALPTQAENVLIHDGARCLIDSRFLDTFSKILSEEKTALIAATPVTDTIKEVDFKGYINSTPEREKLWAAQTPQGFNVKELKSAHQEAIKNHWEVTDDASLFERLGLPVKITECSRSNIKVTTPIDLKIAEILISSNLL